MVMFVAIFYFLIYRPQQKMRRQKQEIMDNLKVGKKIITIGGIHGEIAAINDSTVSLRVADNVVIVANMSAVAVIKEDETRAENDDLDTMDEETEGLPEEE